MSERARDPGSADEPVDAVLAQLYREAERDAPPAHLDAMILAAARREVGSGSRLINDRTSGDAVAHAKRRAWGVPLALAAVIVLSVSILVLSPETRDIVSSESSVPVPFSSPEGAQSELQDAPERRALPPAAREAPKTPDAALSKRDEHNGRPAGAAALPAEEAPSESHPEAQKRFQAQAREAAPHRAESDATVSEWIREYGVQPPEKWGERILELRRQGRRADADALLDAFRRRFPDYAIPAEWTR